MFEVATYDLKSKGDSDEGASGEVNSIVILELTLLVWSIFDDDVANAAKHYCIRFICQTLC